MKLSVILCALFAVNVLAADFGETVESLLKKQTMELFGFQSPIDFDGRGTAVDRVKGQPASDRQRLAGGLTAEFVTRSISTDADMISFWPTKSYYTHLIVCIEGGRASGGINAGVQRVNVIPGSPDYGKVETIVYGTSRCDGIRTTQWGTILATEETGDGAAYEIIDPLTTTDHWISSRDGNGDIRTSVNGSVRSTKIIKRTALVIQAWEGLDVLDNGVIIGGDERRPGNDEDGGAIFKFVPSKLYNCGSSKPVKPGYFCPNLIKNLSESPLVSGKNYALQATCTGDSDYGQGCEAGRAKWLAVADAVNAPAEAFASGATGYCRPEDLAIDSNFGIFGDGSSDPDAEFFKSTFGKEAGIRWCWTNTCGDGLGEVMCGIESKADISAQAEVQINGKKYLASSSGVSRFWVKRFVGGDRRLNSQDNIDIQPFSQNVYVVEDDTWGEIWACLPDGRDRDQMSDGCVTLLSVQDRQAEPTGFAFDASGMVAYYNVQHGSQISNLRDMKSNPVDGSTDDLIKITGFKLPASMCPGVVYGFSLIDTEGVKLAGLYEGMVLDICGMPAGLSIQVDISTCASPPGSVEIMFRKKAIIESAYPYVVTGTRGRNAADPISPPLAAGEAVSVSATPYQDSAIRGKSGKGLTVNFKVVNSCSRRLGGPN